MAGPPGFDEFSSQPTATVFITQVVASVTASPSSPASSTASSQSQSSDSGLSAQAIAGLSLAGGLLLGSVIALLYVYLRNRRETREARLRLQPAQSRDHEALLPNMYSDNEKYSSPTTPQAPPAPPANARILDWVQRTRAVSMSSLASSYFPTIASDNQSTVTVGRSISIGGVSSRSAYSQASAAPSQPGAGRREEEGHPAPPLGPGYYEFEDAPNSRRQRDLYRISEHE
ncbi:hypothetical protein MKEN_00714200 [Mycena kentingensis (nom. inval.)]|nr:hypothetical protein MKEN_00714200 [Mycena kentingensis (nom. inval.)]